MSSLIIKLQFTHLMTINIKLVSIIDRKKHIEQAIKSALESGKMV